MAIQPGMGHISARCIEVQMFVEIDSCSSASSPPLRLLPGCAASDGALGVEQEEKIAIPIGGLVVWLLTKTAAGATVKGLTLAVPPVVAIGGSIFFATQDGNKHRIGTTEQVRSAINESGLSAAKRLALGVALTAVEAAEEGGEDATQIGVDLAAAFRDVDSCLPNVMDPRHQRLQNAVHHLQQILYAPGYDASILQQVIFALEALGRDLERDPSQCFDSTSGSKFLDVHKRLFKLLKRRLGDADADVLARLNQLQEQMGALWKTIFKIG